MLLSKEEILAQRLPTKRVTVPWINGGDAEMIIRAMPMHVAERSMQGKDLKFGGDVYVFVNTVIDENGRRVYSDDDQQQIAENVDTTLIRFVWAVAWQLSEVPDEKKAEIKKNLPKVLADALYGELPSPSTTPTPT